MKGCSAPTVVRGSQSHHGQAVRGGGGVGGLLGRYGKIEHRGRIRPRHAQPSAMALPQYRPRKRVSALGGKVQLRKRRSLPLWRVRRRRRKQVA